jgi:hypothetical protein
MANEKRSGNNYLDSSQSQQWMTLQCLALIKPLNENICGISGQPSNAEIGLFAIKEHISDGLEYACVYWPFHASQIVVERNIPVDVNTAVWQFLDNNVLQWIECMSLVHQLKIAIEGLQKLKIWRRVRLTL